MNDQYTHALKDFTQAADKSKYIIVGSIALLSYTQKHGYDREVHDIDIVMEKQAAEATKNKLLELGYKQDTFINKRMPFYNSLMKYSTDRYLRFTKDNVNVEILSTRYSEKDGLHTFEIYPGIKAGFPREEIVESDFNGVPFTTISKEMIYFIKRFANSSFGKVSNYKEEQRLKDLEQINKLIDQDKLHLIGKKCRIYLFGLAFKVPGFIYKQKR